LSAQAVGNALDGLKSMSSDVPEVREMLRVLVPKIVSCTEALDAQAVGNALYGLKSMSSDVSEVREVLKVLIPKIGSCTEALSAQNIGMALYGLQSMSSDVPEVCEVLKVFAMKTALFVKPADLQFVANFLYGLIPMSLDSCWKSILSMLFINIEQSLSVSGQHIAIAYSKELQALNQTLSIISVPKVDNKLRNALVSFDLLEDFNRLLSSVSLLASKRLSELNSDPTTSFRNRDEKKYAHSIMKLFKDRQNINILTKKYLFGFEADIIVRVTHSNGKESIINVEIDGIHHHRPVKRLFCRRRDDYLILKNNVRVIRVKLPVSRMLSK
jgi:hypothetical protein